MLAPKRPGVPSEPLIVARGQAFDPLAAKVRIEARLANSDGTAASQTIDAVYYERPLRAPPVPESRASEQIRIHEFLLANQATKILSVRRGRWAVGSDIVVPRGWGLEVQAGTRLDFAPGAAIISHGPLSILGTADEPIVFGPLKGRAAPWDGIVVLSAPEVSVLRHLHLGDTKSLTRPHWSLTGGLTFYRSDLRLENARIHGHRGEDALNIVASSFTIEASTFVGAASDALDSDFSQGTASTIRVSSVSDGPEAAMRSISAAATLG